MVLETLNISSTIRISSFVHPRHGEPTSRDFFVRYMANGRLQNKTAYKPNPIGRMHCSPVILHNVRLRFSCNNIASGYKTRWHICMRAGRMYSDLHSDCACQSRLLAFWHYWRAMNGTSNQTARCRTHSFTKELACESSLPSGQICRFENCMHPKRGG